MPPPSPPSPSGLALSLPQSLPQTIIRSSRSNAQQGPQLFHPLGCLCCSGESSLESFQVWGWELVTGVSGHSSSGSEIRPLPLYSSGRNCGDESSAGPGVPWSEVRTLGPGMMFTDVSLSEAIPERIPGKKHPLMRRILKSLPAVGLVRRMPFLAERPPLA